MALDWLLRPILYILFMIFTQKSTQTHSISESEALIRFKKSLTTTNSNVLSSWIPGGPDPCRGQQTQWEGLICDNGIVSGLRLENMGLSGKIDVDALIDVSGLRTVSFTRNHFNGTIPELNRLGYLKAIYLSGNQFSGEIPSDYFASMKSLKKVWLSNNMFSGEIPLSLSDLSNLIELHLENNQFNGRIPSLKQQTLTQFNVSHNKLRGDIPSELRRFNLSAFEGNSDLCDEKFGVVCKTVATTPSTPPNVLVSAGPDNSNFKKTIAGIVTLAVMLLSVAAVVFFRMRKKNEEDFEPPENDKHSPEEVVAVQVSAPIMPKDMEGTKKTGSGRKGTASGRAGGVGVLEVMNQEKGVFGLPDLMKAAAEVLGNGGLGSSYKAVMANGMQVVVKRMREVNALGKDGFCAEMRKLGRLRHPNVLTPLAFHYRKDEKLLIYEYIPKGSLLYLLHGDRGPSHAELDFPSRLKILQGIARGLGYLHTELALSQLPHGNLKSSNVLLSPDNEPLISDFGFSPIVNPSIAAQALLGHRAPEATQYGVSPKCDVYCLGIIILEILTGNFPSQYISNGTGGTDVVQWLESAISEGKELEVLDPGIAFSSKSLNEMRQLLHIAASCTASNPQRRLDMREAISRIEEIKLGDGGGDSQDLRTMQVLPSLRDGYADAPQFAMPGTRESFGGHSRTRTGSASISDRSGHQDSGQSSFTIS